ncbi:TetR/AcrR family transcriptional regulator [Acidicapsa ligni]|uniref:TetR/AcrR family transcriptional regulator n=1 Tax=Acidicapsa ligni TaxID=542300 RepID=UPI0021DFACFF|nr:TetR/AcrR family transcriptional regulator [Acidicapsa ligni]
MGRPKGFSREDVLLKSISVFWEKGFAETTVQDLERATGVNKSGLYSEFANKEDIFLASLEHYLQTRGGEEILSAQPLGWDNIRRYLEIGQTCYTGKKGCFSVNSMRDVAMLPAEGQQMISRKNLTLKRLLVRNIKAELPSAHADVLAETILTFFSGLCIEQNLHPNNAIVSRKVAGFMRFLTQSK